MADIVERLREYEWAHYVIRDAANEIERLRAGLEKIRSYNVDTIAGKINYRPHDHIEVIDRALADSDKEDKR